MSVVATCYLLGVSTRRVEKLVETLGITPLSKSQVSEMATDLDAQVEAFRNRPLDAGPYTFVWLPTRWCIKVREGGRTVNVHALLAVGVNADGHREVLGLDVTSDRGRRRLAGVLPRPDRPRPVRGRAGHLRRPPRPGRRDRRRPCPARRGSGAAPTTCATCWRATPKSRSWGWVKALLRTVFDQPDADAVHAQFDRVAGHPRRQVPRRRRAPRRRPRRPAGVHRVPASEIWRQIWSNNPQERLNKEIRRRTDVVGIFPNRTAIIRLVGAVLAEQTDEWTEHAATWAWTSSPRAEPCHRNTEPTRQRPEVTMPAITA